MFKRPRGACHVAGQLACAAATNPLLPCVSLTPATPPGVTNDKNTFAGRNGMHRSPPPLPLLSTSTLPEAFTRGLPPFNSTSSTTSSNSSFSSNSISSSTSSTTSSSSTSCSSWVNAAQTHSSSRATSSGCWDMSAGTLPAGIISPQQQQQQLRSHDPPNGSSRIPIQTHSYSRAVSSHSGDMPAGTQPTGTQPAGTQPTGTQPAGTQPTGTQPAGMMSPQQQHILSSLAPLEPKYRALVDRVLEGGDFLALSRCITLCESLRPDSRRQCAPMLQHALETMRRRGRESEAEASLRVGVTGPPGAGKSTLIEALGLQAVQSGQRVAVLAVDPSSPLGGGSILGDKTRMDRLSEHPRAFIRPSPSGQVPGGIARATDESALLCEAAGCNTVFVETVGGGQADVAVAAVVDMLLLVLPPAGGDSLQGIKRGVMECADLVLVNKADGALKEPATAAAWEVQSSLPFIRPRFNFWTAEVLLCSARTGSGIPEVWESVARFKEALSKGDQLQQGRARQRQTQWRASLESELLLRVWSNPSMSHLREDIDRAVECGAVCPRAAVESVVNHVLAGTMLA